MKIHEIERRQMPQKGFSSFICAAEKRGADYSDACGIVTKND